MRRVLILTAPPPPRNCAERIRRSTVRLELGVSTSPYAEQYTVDLRAGGCIDRLQFAITSTRVGEHRYADRANSRRSLTPTAVRRACSRQRFVQLQQVGDDRVKVGLGQSIRLSPRCSQKALRMIGCTVLLATPAVCMHPSWVVLPNQGTFAPVAGSPTH
jgi:hypothetical protein